MIVVVVAASMGGLLHLAVLAVAVFLMVSPSQCGLEVNDDVLGLIVFKADLHDPKSSLASWNEDDDSPCLWAGVICSPKTGRVTEVVLDNLSLSGKIGRGLTRLQFLHTLSLAYNNFSGDISISSDLAQIPSLRIMNLNHNAFSGAIPPELFRRCDSLRVLSLSSNALQGALPSSLSSCSSLTALNLSANHLSGSLPGSIWSLKNLRSLDLSHNSFVGTVPEGVGGLNSLREIHLNNNNFSGPLPADLGDCGLLRNLDFSHNVLSGSLPDSLQRLNFVSAMSFSANLLVGTIPSWIGSLRNLESLDLSGNSFTGELPSLSSLQNVRLINVSYNKLSGPLPESLMGCTRLYSVDFSSNGFTGSIPGELFELGLQNIYLSRNLLTGSIPQAGSPKLHQFLEELDLSHNMLSGEIPPSISQCSNLKFLNLSDNLIASKIPSEIGNLKLLASLDLSYNHLFGGIPATLGNASALSVLQLDGNFLSGRIPAEIGECSSLALLSLAHNSLTGNVPKELAKLRRLKILNLAMNNLTGELPQQLGNLGHLLSVNISHNKLKGRIPTGGIFNTLNRTSLEGNAGLCGSGVNVSCPMVMPKPIVLNPNSSGNPTGGGILVIKSKRNRIVLSVSAIIAISAAAAIAFGVVAVTILNIRAQSSSRSMNLMLDSFSQSPSTDMALGKLVMFTPNSDHASEDWMTSAHALINKDCELGRGGFGTVYKAVLGDGRIVAIKKLMVSSLVKSQEDFEKEIQLLRRIKHPNLVNLQGYYWTPQLQLLIYDYIQSGSLYSRLHERSQTDSSLSWSSRFNIALGTAMGLAHLHHACRPPVIHYNIKSSNILLDENCNPKVADYGLAKLLPMLDRYILSSKIQSALGYMAPEFACQSLKINERCDVYGFGVLLLELVTGRRPVEYMEDDVVILCDNVRSLLDEGKALTCVDSSLSEYPEDEVIPVIKLGLICTSQVPSNRPSMSEVVHILELIRSPMESRETP